MGAEAGQSLLDIIRRKELERECGGGVFAWGIGNSVGPSINHARRAEQLLELETLFTPMKAAAKSIDTSPPSVVMWMGYVSRTGDVKLLPRHILVTSRGQSVGGREKRSHFALICHSPDSLVVTEEHEMIDHRAVRNLVSSNPVGASQVTSVVRYSHKDSRNATYPVLFRAKLAGPAFVRLAIPVPLTGELFNLYRAVCASRAPLEWLTGIDVLKNAAMSHFPPSNETGNLLEDNKNSDTNLVIPETPTLERQTFDVQAPFSRPITQKKAALRRLRHPTIQR